MWLKCHKRTIPKENHHFYRCHAYLWLPFPVMAGSWHCFNHTTAFSQILCDRDLQCIRSDQRPRCGRGAMHWFKNAASTTENFGSGRPGVGLSVRKVRSCGGNIPETVAKLAGWWFGTMEFYDRPYIGQYHPN